MSDAATLAKLKALQDVANQQYNWEKPIDAAASGIGQAMTNVADKFGNKIDQFIDPSAVRMNRPGGMGQVLPQAAVQPSGDPQSDANFAAISAANRGSNPADAITQQKLDDIESAAAFGSATPSDKAFMKERDPQRFQKLFGGQ